MNILLLTDDMLPGGVPRHVVDLANGLSERGVDVIVAATDGSSRNGLCEGTRFVNLPITHHQSLRKNYSGLPEVIPGLIREVTRSKVQIIHSHKRYSDVLARMVATVTRVKHVSTCHNTFNDFKRLSPFGDFTIACSDVVHEMLVKEFRKPGDKVRMIYYGVVPLREFENGTALSARIDLGFESTTRVVASIGHLSKAKDRETLLRAIAFLRWTAAREDFVLALLGDGVEAGRLRALAAEFRIENHVRFLRADTNVEALLNVSEFCVLSSIQEGLPYALLEAASIGKPHVATAVGGVPDFVSHNETGLLVPPNDPKALGGAIGHLLDHPEECKRLGANAKVKVQQQHDYDRFIEETMEVYEHVLRKS
ncbi:MAG TPA: hypothetical protein DCP63_15775 [Bacteroidetes bacterium]|nr:hypothetical protein [Bacteroidota bacterium]